jgi:hypothetical protein
MGMKKLKIGLVESNKKIQRLKTIKATVELIACKVEEIVMVGFRAIIAISEPTQNSQNRELGT